VRDRVLGASSELSGGQKGFAPDPESGEPRLGRAGEAGSERAVAPVAEDARPDDVLTGGDGDGADTGADRRGCRLGGARGGVEAAGPGKLRLGTDNRRTESDGDAAEPAARMSAECCSEVAGVLGVERVYGEVCAGEESGRRGVSLRLVPGVMVFAEAPSKDPSTLHSTHRASGRGEARPTAVGLPDVASVDGISAAGSHASPTDPFLANRDKTVPEYGVSRETESPLGRDRMSGLDIDGPSGGFNSATGAFEQGVPQPRIGSGYAAQASTGWRSAADPRAAPRNARRRALPRTGFGCLGAHLGWGDQRPDDRRSASVRAGRGCFT
jgi:hypothetical protein